MKRGQAALEFLMTYGWAILVVLVVIGALAYFGVLNPNILVPEKCTLQTGIACKDFLVSDDADPDTVVLDLENGMGKGIIITDITATQLTSSIACTTGALTTTIENGQSSTFTANCPADPGGLTDDGRKTKLSLAITYYYQDSDVTFSHTAEGEILAKIE